MNKEACHQAAYREFILSASFIRADWHSQYPLLMMEMPICMHTNGERYRGRKAEGTEGGEGLEGREIEGEDRKLKSVQVNFICSALNQIQSQKGFKGQYLPPEE